MFVVVDGKQEMVSLTIEYTQKIYFYYSTSTIQNTEAGPPVHLQHENVSITILPTSCPPEKRKKKWEGEK